MIVECTFEGMLASTGACFQPSYVEVLTERDGLIAAVRDYENLAYRAHATSPRIGMAQVRPTEVLTRRIKRSKSCRMSGLKSPSRFRERSARC